MFCERLVNTVGKESQTSVAVNCAIGMVSTIMVFVMVIIASLFFFVVDQIFSFGVKNILGLGG